MRQFATRLVGHTISAGRGLHRLAQAHVVGQHRAQPGAAQELQPVHAALLVRSQVGTKRAGHGRGGNAIGVAQHPPQHQQP
jgi:hypothetical protein